MSEPLILEPRRRIRGRLRVPGDKSISHRALLLGCLAGGKSCIRGLASGEDVVTTRRIVEKLGIAVCEMPDGVMVAGRGWAGLDRDAAEPVLELDCGNSGTTARLLLGLLAGRRGHFRLVGDASLSRRPMDRVVEPLRQLGARITGGDRLPLAIEGSALTAARIVSRVPSAQVKSALLLAALQARGTTTLVVPPRSRDHTERMLTAMGAPVDPLADESGFRVRGGAPRLAARDWDVPGDPSSAAFFVALACCLAGSQLTVPAVSLNPRRLGFYRLLARMGADLRWTADEDEAPEPVGTIFARPGSLHGITVEAGEIVEAIDEVPLLAIVATAAEGTTTLSGAEELRVKESDRIAAIVRLVRDLGGVIEERHDGFALRGPQRLEGGRADAGGDHRIAMAAAVASVLSAAPVQIEGHQSVSISYPGFFDDLARLTCDERSESAAD